MKSRGTYFARYTAPGLSAERMYELQEAFDLFDSNKTGSIDAREVKAAIRALGFEVGKEHVWNLLAQVRRDGEEGATTDKRRNENVIGGGGGGDDDEIDELLDSRVTFGQFVRIMTAQLERRDTREEIWKIYKLFDTDQKGYINQADLETVCAELGEDLPPAEMQDMIKEADVKGKFGGRGIDFEDFCKVMKLKSEHVIDHLTSSSDEDEEKK